MGEVSKLWMVLSTLRILIPLRLQKAARETGTSLRDFTRHTGVLLSATNDSHTQILV